MGMNWNSIDEARRAITKWADKQFPMRTSQGTLLKLYGEIGELVADPSSPLELADVFILLLDYASMHNIDVAKAIAGKMALNRSRKWKFNEHTGLAQHIEEELQND